MANFNPTITAYLVPYIREGYEFCHWVSLLLKVEHISYTMSTRALPDIYALALGPVALDKCRQSTRAHGITIAKSK